MCFDGQLNGEQISKYYEYLNENTQSRFKSGYSLFNVGLMHERGMGQIKQDYKIAINYYEQAIKDDVHDAYCNLGNIYIMGSGMHQGIPRDVDKGVDLLTIGANEGSREAAFTLGSLFGKGELIKQDLKKSFYFLTLAAFAKHEQAHRVLHIFQNTHHGNFTQEFEAAEVQYWKIQNLQRLYKCL